MSVALSSATATCPVCGHQVSQISTTREHAVEVVTTAMNAHMATEHSEGDRSVQ